VEVAGPAKGRKAQCFRYFPSLVRGSQESDVATTMSDNRSINRYRWRAEERVQVRLHTVVQPRLWLWLQERANAQPLADS
jgi:hypothetical protein